MKSFRVIPLGVRGWMPTEQGESMCVAVVIGDELILLDCGTGARRLRSPFMAGILNGVRRVTILLSHYHLDHILGLVYLPGLLSGRDVCIAGPGRELSDASFFDTIKSLAAFPLFSHPIEEFPMNLVLRELSPGENHFPNFTVAARRQVHTAPSTGMRIDDLVAYATDTEPDAETSKLARGVDLLLHEAWLDDADYNKGVLENISTSRGHSSASAAARIAAEAGFRRLGLIHLNPSYSDDRLAEMHNEAKRIFPNSLLLKDMEEI